MLKKILTLFIFIIALASTTQIKAQSITVNIAGSTSGSPLSASITSGPTNVLCKGASTGSVTVTGAGGNGSFGYIITGGNITGATTGAFTGLVAGTYTVTVTSATCTATQAVTITEPASSVTAAVSGTLQIACGTSTASATVTALGGTSPYTYGWPGGTTFTPSNPAAGASTATGLAAGTYNVTVTDANSCATSTSPTPVVITAPNSTLSATVTPTQILCNSVTPGGAGSTAGIVAITSVLPNTATPAYTWSNTGTGSTNVIAQTTASVSALAAGTYTVSISALGYCPVSYPSTINAAPVAVSAIFVKADDGCETNLGTVTLTGTGGTGPYNMKWVTATENPVTNPHHPSATGTPAINVYTSAAATGSFSNLTGGYDYKFVIKDGIGCTTQ